MDKNILLWIIGLVLSTVIAFLIYLLQKKRNYPAKLNFALVERKKVLTHLPENYNSLKLNYKDYSVSNNLEYFKGVLYNNRPCDVSSLESDGLISLDLPSAWKWVDINICSKSAGLEGSIIIDENCCNRANLHIPLIKNKEALQIEGLIESPNIQHQSKSFPFKFKHRIKDLDDIKIEECRYTRRNNIILSPIFLIFITSLLAIFIFIFMDSSPIRYKCITSGESVYASIDSNGAIEVDNPFHFIFIKHGVRLTKEQFEAGYVADYSYHKGGYRYVEFSMFILMAVLSMAVLVFMYRERLHKKTINNIISSLQRVSN